MSEKSEGYITIKYPPPLKGTKTYWKNYVAQVQLGIYGRVHAIRSAIQDDDTLAQVRANVMMLVERMEAEVKNQEMGDVYNGGCI